MTNYTWKDLFVPNSEEVALWNLATCEPQTVTHLFLGSLPSQSTSLYSDNTQGWWRSAQDHDTCVVDREKQV